MKNLLFFAAILISNLALAQIPENGLVGYWPFNDNADSEISDVNNGTIYGATSVSDRLKNANSAYSFDGNNDYITCGTDNLGIQTAISISVWVKTDDIKNQYVVTKYGSGDAGYHLSLYGGVARFNGRDGNNEYIPCLGNTVISDGKWHHLIGISNNGVWQIWVDGILETENNTGHINVNIAASNPLEFGQNVDYPGNEFNGEIDDIRIYDRALEENEIFALLNEGDNDVQSPWQTNGEDIFYNSPGNVGIGTTSPDYKLDVEGTIRAHEIKVNLDEGADFVFEEDYNLMPLNELESFVKTKKHLPEVAPAKQMEAEGLSISEMNAKLLQKIEELTLYTIEQQKTIDKLLENNEKLNERVETLENKK